MIRFDRAIFWCRSVRWQASLLALSAAVWLMTSPVALAAKKKAEKVVEEGKGYTLPYMFVIAVLSVGLMAVLRPGRRLDKADPKKADE